MPTLETLSGRGGVRLLTIASGSDANPDNRFTAEWLTDMEQALDELEAIPEGEPAALVTMGADKFFSNGLDVSVFTDGTSDIPAYLDRVQAVLRRFLTLQMTTVAAVNGHAFGAGAMLVLAHDVRIMREDRGYFCLPESTLKMPFPHGMNALVRNSLIPSVSLEAMITGRRYTAAEARESFIVSDTETEAELRKSAIARAESHVSVASSNLRGIKAGAHAATIEALKEPVSATGAPTLN